LGRDETNSTDNILQIGLVFRNAADGPLLYDVERFDVVLENRTIAAPAFLNRGGVIPRGGATTYRYPPFGTDAIKPHMNGTIRYSIRYGHPEIGFSRRCKKELAVSIRCDDKTAASYLIRSESDEEID
jgi:hypothetical protein